MYDLRFTIPEILSLIGIFQCLYILVYILFRAGRLSRTFLPSLYFLLLGIGFFLDFAQGFIGDATLYYALMRWFVWLTAAPLSFLVIVQFSQITKAPPLRHYLILLLPVLALALSSGLSYFNAECETFPACDVFHEWYLLFGQLAGALSLLAIWLVYPLWGRLLSQKHGRERYWLVISFLGMNVGFLITLFGYYNPAFKPQDLMVIQTIIGLGFVYLVMTSLFRVYPPSVRMLPNSDKDDQLLSDEELELALKVESLLALEKIYHEAGYSRSDLAQELSTSETIVSKIINLHFGKTFPQLLNEYRVEDAKVLLADTDAEIKIVAEEVGFNSLASFNRAFKEFENVSPSQFRASKKP